MLNLIKKLLGLKPGVNLAELIAQGATIVDVRSLGEYASGHLKSTVNIPLSELKQKLGKIRKDKPVITCCASGVRSGAAKGILKAAGYTQVHNGGSWGSLKRYL
jgi:phage shock protein E